MTPASTTTAHRWSLCSRIWFIYAFLATANIAAWLWAVAVFGGHPVLLGTALVVYGLGLRHAVDVDHIAAIDNVTRKLMQDGDRPVTVGFFFALGHSAIIAVASAMVAVTTNALENIGAFRDWIGMTGTGLSAAFLLTVAVINLAIFLSVYRVYRQVRAGRALIEDEFNLMFDRRGGLARLFRPLLKFITKSWHMLALGVLFGLGFDTATEVAMFGISASQAAKGLSVGAILVFPALFAAGMTLIDTTDGIVMLGVYHWALNEPRRKIQYNMVITLSSAAVALFIGGLELLDIWRKHSLGSSDFWRFVALANDRFNAMGLMVAGFFVLAWAVSFGVGRLRSAGQSPQS